MPYIRTTTPCKVIDATTTPGLEVRDLRIKNLVEVSDATTGPV